MESKVRPVKSIERAIPAMDGAGVKLKRAFGNMRGLNLDPFLLLDQMWADDPKDTEAGFPWHPHRGIETVTYIIEGEADHEDSLGNKGTLKGGEIQWMTAGSGIIHQEMPRPENNGLLHGFQLWVNLPQSQKMMMPRYQDIKRAEIPELIIDNDVKIKILAGNFNENKGPVQDVISQPTYLDVEIDSESKFSHAVNSDHTLIAFIINGEGYFDNTKNQLASKEDLVVFNQGEEISIETDKDRVRFLLMSGQPIRESVAWHGPIVMNTRDELVHAFEELNRGTFIKHEYRV